MPKVRIAKLRHTAGRALVVALICLAASGCVRREFAVRDDSMMPNLQPGTRFSWEPIRSDESDLLWRIVVAELPEGEPARVFRVAALPGERVRLDHHGLRVDGDMRRPDFPGMVYRFEAFEARFGYREYYKVPEDCFYLLHDNPLFGRDSRAYGAVPRERIKGVFVERR